METRDYRFNILTKIKFILVIFFLAAFSASFAVVPALAGDQEPMGGESYEDYINRVGGQQSTGLGNAFKTDPGSPLDAVAVKGGGFNTNVTFEIIVSTVLTMVLGLMGAIFLVLAIYAGYNWMMARGNEEMVEKSKKTLANAIIGIIVVLAAYAMVRIIVEILGRVVFKTS